MFIRFSYDSPMQKKREHTTFLGVKPFDAEQMGTVATFPTGESGLDWRACIKYKETAVLRTPVPVSLRPAIQGHAD